MSKGKFVAFSLIAAALLSWQVAGVNNATSGTSGIVDPCSSLASYTGPDTVCFMSCPLDDGRDLDTDLGTVIYLTAKDGSGTPIVGLPTQDVWLVGCADGLVLCGGSGAIDGDSVTNANGETTITGDMSGSGCDLTGISVVIQGVVVADATTCLPICLSFIANSPDKTGDGGIVDGIVELADFAQFGIPYNKPLLYDACWDFNCDYLNDLLDFSIFGQHWEHSCQG